MSLKVKQLVSSATAVRYQILDNELEALLTEAELIKLYQPHYNSLLKDDKSPLYIITTKEKYPRVLTVRKGDIAAQLYNIRRSFGPLPSAAQVKEVLKIARKLFPYCTQNRTKPPHQRACFYFHLGLCPGACTEKVAVKTYQKSIHHLELFLSGKYKSVITTIKKEITQASADLRFEEAHQLKMKIEAIESVVYRFHSKTAEQPLPQLTDNNCAFINLELKRLLKLHQVSLPKLNRIEAYDVANIQGKSPTVSMVVTINGEAVPTEYRHFTIKSLSTPNDIGMLKEAIIRRQRHPEWGIPDLILIDGGKGQVKAIKQCLTWQIPVIGITKQPDRLIIPPTHPLGHYVSLHLIHNRAEHQIIINLRDEAHRFARKLFHKHYEKQLLNA